jgi:hypothetical protein
MAKPTSQAAKRTSTKAIARNAVKGGPKDPKKDKRTSEASRGREKGG